MYRASALGTAWQGSWRDLANVILRIRRLRMFGRLSLRNTERLSVAHLYFRGGRLVHVVGNRGDTRAILLELKEWPRGSVRFDRGDTTTMPITSIEYEQVLDEVLFHLQRRGIIVVPPEQQASPTQAYPITEPQHVIESNLVATTEIKQLITPWEWQILTEGTRRVSLAVAHLVGPKEALSVLRDILDDCASAFPAFSCIEIAPSGYLHVINSSQLERMPRIDLLEGFTALFATCEYFCSPIIGEKEAHDLLIQALRDIGPVLVQLGVFQLHRQLSPG